MLSKQINFNSFEPEKFLIHTKASSFVLLPKGTLISKAFVGKTEDEYFLILILDLNYKDQETFDLYMGKKLWIWITFYACSLSQKI